jgi:CheY-like chemotaxis protein
LANPATILCIDDEEPGLRVRKLVLEAQGYIVLATTSAEECLQLFRDNDIDLVLSDHLLPTLTGTELAQRMKQIKPAVPIALLTGLPEPPSGMEYADCLIVKGEDINVFLRKVSELLSGSRRARRAAGAS